ncbi:MAG: hypothetical protein EXS08_10190 [Planctomycetes bacterium]|nr:hypothetical protein [Planctomycetota bacterium]
MLSRSPFAAVVLCLSAVPLAAQEDAARLVPPSTNVLVRLESLRAWNELVRGFAPLGGAALANYDLQQYLDSMGWDPSREAPAANPTLDAARALYLAVQLNPMAGTLIAPVESSAPFHFHPEFFGGREQSVHLGSYTGVSMIPEYAANAAPSPLLAQLRPGLASAHVDLAALIATFRPVIDMGLRQAEMRLDQLPNNQGMDLQALMELYLGMARSMLDSAQAFDLALEREGDELALRFDYLESVERLPGARTAAVTGLLGAVDPDSSVQAAYNGSWAELLGWLDDFSEVVFDAYPEPLRGDLQRMADLQRELAPLLEPGLAFGLDFTTEGLHGEYVLRSKQAAEVAARFETMLRSLERPQGMLHVGASERMVVEGQEVRVVPVEIRYETLGTMMDTLTGGAEFDAAVKQQMQETLATLYGRNLRIAFASQGETLLLVVANNDGELRRDFARLRKSETPSPKMTRLLQRIEPGAVGFAYHVDLGQTLGQLIDAFHGLLPWATYFPRTAAALEFWGSLRGGHWAGGMALSQAELIELVRAVQGLEPK